MLPPVTEMSDWAETIAGRRLLHGLWLSDQGADPATAAKEIAFAKSKGAYALYIHADGPANRSACIDVALQAIMACLLPIYGINVPAYLPLGMILNDVFAFIIGFAIVKERLFDITLIVKRSALYSVLAAVAIFVFSLSEHTLAAYLGNLIGEKSRMPEFVSVAVAIAVLLPLYRRLEHTLDVYFAKRRIDF